MLDNKMATATHELKQSRCRRCCCSCRCSRTNEDVAVVADAAAGFYHSHLQVLDDPGVIYGFRFSQVIQSQVRIHPVASSIHPAIMVCVCVCVRKIFNRYLRFYGQKYILFSFKVK